MAGKRTKNRIIVIAIVAILALCALLSLLIGSGEGGGETYEYAGVKIPLIKSWHKKVLIVEPEAGQEDLYTIARIFHKANHEQGKKDGIDDFGLVVSIVKFPKEIALSEFDRAARITGGAHLFATDDEGNYFVALSPTDVQTSLDKKMKKEYDKIEDALQKQLELIIKENSLIKRDIKTSPVLKYYEYFKENSRHINPLVEVGENTLDDDLMMFVFQNVGDASRAEGISKKTVDDLLKKFFGRTVKSFDSVVSGSLANGNVYFKKGFSFPGEARLVLKDLEFKKEKDSFIAEFDLYIIPDDVFANGNIELIEQNIINSDFAAKDYYVKTSVIDFSEVSEKDGYYIKFNEITHIRETYEGPLGPGTLVDIPQNDDYSQRVKKDELLSPHGLTLGIDYDEAVLLIGTPDEFYANEGVTKTVVKNGWHYGFYKMDGEAGPFSGVPNDGKYRLLTMSIRTWNGQTFRDIKIGDDLESVLNKLPGNDKTPKKWAEQNIYGIETSRERAVLYYTVRDGKYNLSIISPEFHVSVLFDKSDKVEWVEYYVGGF